MPVSPKLGKVKGPRDGSPDSTDGYLAPGPKQRGDIGSASAGGGAATTFPSSAPPPRGSIAGRTCSRCGGSMFVQDDEYGDVERYCTSCGNRDDAREPSAEERASVTPGAGPKKRNRHPSYGKLRL